MPSDGYRKVFLVLVSKAFINILVKHYKIPCTRIGDDIITRSGKPPSFLRIFSLPCVFLRYSEGSVRNSVAACINFVKILRGGGGLRTSRNDVDTGYCDPEDATGSHDFGMVYTLALHPECDVLTIE